MAFQKGHISWNKGLTKETDKRVKQASENQSGIKKDFSNYRGEKHHLYGKPSIMKGKHHTKKAKEKIRKSSLGRIPWNKGTKGIMKAWSKGLKLPQWSGKNSPSWKGGITPENERIRKSLEFKLWREKVFIRDDYTCQKCKKRDGKILHPHHIFNFAQFINLRFELLNGITFCEKCHKEFHKIYGRKNNNQQQINEFLIH